MQRIIKTIICAAIILHLAACQAQQDTGSEAAETTENATPADLSPEQVFVIGDISSDPADTIETFQPLATYLAGELSDLGIEKGAVVVASDLPTMLEYLESGEVDLYFDSPYPALTAYEDAGAHPLVRRWKGGVGEYNTVIVVRQDSGITDMDGLVGALIAFEEPVSTSGYLLPAAFLASQGYQLTENDSATSINADEIGYTFAGSEENVLAWVLEGKTVGAVLQNDAFDELDAETKAQLLIVAETPTVPRHIALAWPGMDDAMQQRLTDILMAMDETSEGQMLLEGFEKTAQFDELPGGPENMMRSLQDLFATVRFATVR
jgi:phosphonate transport system substrate-binding protein